MKLRLKRISPASLAATLAAMYFVVGMFIAIFGVVAALSGGHFALKGPFTFSGSGVAMLPLVMAYPFILALMGAATGFIVAWLYNAVTRFTKGVLVECNEAGRFES